MTAAWMTVLSFAPVEVASSAVTWITTRIVTRVVARIVTKFITSHIFQSPLLYKSE
jgi:hypothetical protein